MKIYTKTGDAGKTNLQGNIKISKANPRIMAYGSVDEVNAVLGMILADNIDKDIANDLILIQNELFVVGADLSNPNLENAKNRVTSDMVNHLEKSIDSYELELKPLTNFILPGGEKIAAQLHFCRTVVRRAESQVVILSESETINKECIRYLNRLSDFLFVLARVINKRNRRQDIVWKV
ncbi:MAG: cob(I)yrinic acid a,c-diamide adenosyltransferase [Nitrosopumilaceae archaeon]|nr:cob(I)yrinic acid a,c-diamide adenosyltransferase [Nitrosopumilaceae archaeon]